MYEMVSLFSVVDVLRGSLPPTTGNTKFPKSRTGGTRNGLWHACEQTRPYAQALYQTPGTLQRSFPKINIRFLGSARPIRTG
jgi:hypothetical protein